MSSTNSSDRAALVAALTGALREVTALGVLFSQAMADHLGIGSTDMECLDLLMRNGPVTAGRLAELTGLTTGAVTGLIDRLERAGYVRREQDPNDRRRVIISSNSEREAELLSLASGMQQAVEALYTRYTDAELALILGFVNRASAVSKDEISRLGREAAPAWPSITGG